MRLMQGVWLGWAMVVVMENLLAHPGRVDSHGCHFNQRTGQYHCHRKKDKKRKKSRDYVSAQEDFVSPLFWESKRENKKLKSFLEER